MLTMKMTFYEVLSKWLRFNVQSFVTLADLMASKRFKPARSLQSNALAVLETHFTSMKEFRYIEINERLDGIEALHKIGDLVQQCTYSDYENYNWVGEGKIGLVVDIKFFIQESFDSLQYTRYVTEYKIQWIDSSGYSFLDESMIIKLEKK